MIEPLVVGWGWGANRTLTFGSDYLDYMQWLGTNDLSAYLSVPSAIQFQQDHEWTAVRQRCHQLLQQAQQRLCEITGLASIYPDEAGFYHQMASIPLPQIDDLLALKHSLLADYRIEVPLVTWNGRHFIRISVQAYNNQADIDHLINALQELLPVHTKTG